MLFATRLEVNVHTETAFGSGRCFFSPLVGDKQTHAAQISRRRWEICGRSRVREYCDMLSVKTPARQQKKHWPVGGRRTPNLVCECAEGAEPAKGMSIQNLQSSGSQGCAKNRRFCALALNQARLRLGGSAAESGDRAQKQVFMQPMRGERASGRSGSSWRFHPRPTASRRSWADARRAGPLQC